MDLTICLKMSGQDGESRARFLIRYPPRIGPCLMTDLPNADRLLGHLCSRHRQTSCSRSTASQHFRCHSFSRHTATTRASKAFPDRGNGPYDSRQFVRDKATTTTLRFDCSRSAEVNDAGPGNRQLECIVSSARLNSANTRSNAAIRVSSSRSSSIRSLTSFCIRGSNRSHSSVLPATIDPALSGLCG